MGARFRAAVIGLLLFAGWQCLTVQRNYGGNWTALFCTGGNLPVPPTLRAGTFVFANSLGYDGQMYRYVAHDPSLTGEAHRYLDDSILRGRRILVPGLAWVLALGRQSWVDGTYLAVTWLFAFLGCYWCGLPFLLLPATLISMDRLTIDIATCALTGGFIRYWSGKRDRMLYGVVALACLSRETGAILILACVVEAIAHRRWRRAAIFATAILPAAAWYAFLWSHGPAASTTTGLPASVTRPPGFAPFQRMLHPVAYHLPAGISRLAQVLDSAALAGVMAAVCVAVWYGIRKWKEAPGAAALLFAVTFFALSGTELWDTLFNYARLFSPMLLLAAMSGQQPRWLLLAPCILIDSRIFLQLAPQVLGLFGIHAT